MLSTFYRCMGITCNIRRGRSGPGRPGPALVVAAPAVAAHPEPPGARPGPGPAFKFVVAASTVSAHPEPPGARQGWHGLRRCLRRRRRGAPGAARGPAGPAFVVAASTVAAQLEPEGGKD